jgi:hypothetical protein
MLRLGIAAESHRDATTACALGDRVLVESAEWADGQLEIVRVWTGLGSAPFFDLHLAHREAKRRGVATHGHFRDGPGFLDAQSIRNTLNVFADDAADNGDFAVVVIARDTDGDPERLQGFEQAAAEGDWGFVPVGAIAHPELEAWLLAAFVPETPDEQAKLAEVRQSLGFDPTLSAAELKSGRETAKRDAKRILALLVSPDDAHERLLAQPLDQLRARGGPSGLTAYLNTLRAALSPHLGAHPA